MIRFLFLILCVLSLSACRNKTQNIHSDSSNEMNSRQDTILISSEYPESAEPVTLHRIADSIFYVGLKCKNLGKPLQVHYLDSLILVSDMRNIRVLDASGNCMREIPLVIGGFDLLPAKSEIYTYSSQQRKIEAYTFGGKKIWSTKVKITEKEFGFYGYSFAAINDSTFAISIRNTGNNFDQLVFINKTGYIVHHVANAERFLPPPTTYSRNAVWHHPLFRVYDGVRYHPNFSDTLFSIADTIIVPRAIEQKTAKVPLEKRMEYTGNNNLNEMIRYCKENDKYATRFYDTERFLVVNYRMADLDVSFSNYLIYDKKTKELGRSFSDFVQGLETGKFHFGIFNDIDGGLGFTPDYQSGNYLIMVNAGENQGAMKDMPKQLYQEGRMAEGKRYKCKSNSALNSEYKMSADEFFEKISKEQNILTIVKLKNRI